MKIVVSALANSPPIPRQTRRQHAGQVSKTARQKNVAKRVEMLPWRHTWHQHKLFIILFLHDSLMESSGGVKALVVGKSKPQSEGNPALPPLEKETAFVWRCFHALHRTNKNMSHVTSIYSASHSLMEGSDAGMLSFFKWGMQRCIQLVSPISLLWMQAVESLFVKPL